jgi:hypothetical protein
VKDLFDLIRRRAKNQAPGNDATNRREARGTAGHELPANRTKAQQLTDFAAELSRLKHQAGELGLWLTMRRLEPALRMVGFEISGDPEACYRHEAAADRAIAKAALHDDPE